MSQPTSQPKSERTSVAAYCTQCRSRCGCTATVEEGRLIGIEPLPEHPSGAKLCPKGKAAPELVYHPDRLTKPLRRRSPKGAAEPVWEAISWEEALDEIAAHMARIRDAHGPEQVAFSVTTPSGTHISDCISWIERFIRAYGSPNTIYGTEICNWHKDIASRFTYGSDIGTPDYAATDCVLLWGHNPTATWLARATEIQNAVRRGAKLIVVDPRPTPFSRRADAWLRVRPGTDQAVALGLLHLQFESGAFDMDFARRWSNAALLVAPESGRLLRESDLRDGGREDILLAADEGGAPLLYDMTAKQWRDDPARAALFGDHELAGADDPVRGKTVLQLLRDAAAFYPPEKVEALAGVDPEALRQAAALLGSSASVAYYAWNGVGQSVTATQTDRAISSLYALTGHYGARGGNVPGGAGRFNDISGQDLLSLEQRAKALGLAERPLGPGRHGWVTARDVYRAVTEGAPYPVRMLFSFGGNPLAAQPETELAKAAFEKLEFHVHTDFFLNPSAAYADIVLPAATSWEREGLRNGFDASLEGLRRVQLRKPVIAPMGEARSDTDIVLELSRRLGLSDRMFDCDADKGHDHLLAPSGLDVATLRTVPEGVVLPGDVPDKAYLDAGFPTPSGLIELYSETFLAHGQAPLPALDPAELPQESGARFPLRLGSAKTIVYCHSQHRNIPSLRRLQPDPILEMSPELAAARGIDEHDWVEVSTKAGGFRAKAKFAKGLAPEAVYAQHGWTIGDAVPDAGADGRPLPANLNGAVSTERADPISGSIPLRCSWCEIRKL